MALNAKILVTGAGNLIGRALIKSLLSEGKTVRAIAHKSSNIEAHENLDFKLCSLLDVDILDDAVQGIEQVYHCDELMSFLPSDKQKCYKVNVVGTENLLNLSLIHKVKKLVYLSSNMAFGTYQHKKNINENTRCTEHKNNNYYALTKNRAELEVYRAKAEGLKTTIICPGIVLTKATQYDKCHFVALMQQRKRLFLKGKNAFVGLDDLLAICKKLMQEDYEEDKFIASAENLSYEKVFKILNPDIQQKSIFLRVFKNTIARFNDFRNIALGSKVFWTSEVSNFDNKEFIFENQKVRTLLKFEFTPIEKVLKKLK